MRALAEFIMRGRAQSSLVALAGNLVPLLSPATIGLVTLRRGFADGLFVLLWAALPLVVVIYLTGASDLVVMTSVTGLAAVAVSAEVLRGTLSWEKALLAALATCSVLVVALGAARTGIMETTVTNVQTVLTSLQGEGTEAGSPFYTLMAVTALGLGVETVTGTYVLGFLSWLTAVNVIAGLLVARWWQALLYNPGGFQQEFHGFRLGMTAASLLMAGVAAGNLLAVEYRAWASLLGMPLLLSGLGLAHHTVKLLGLSTFWLVAMYAGLILIGPLSLALIVTGFLDSFLNFRARLAKNRG